MLFISHSEPAKRLLILFCILMITGCLPSIASDKPLDPITTINAKVEYNKVVPESLTDINLEINEEEKHQLRKDSPEVSMDDRIRLTPEEAELNDALEFQKANDVEDIKILWDSTIHRNPVIRFALEKIATPPEKRAAKSSLMARTLSTMIQGTAILPTIFGMGAATEYTSAFGGQIINNAFSKKFVPEQGMPSITEPELIQLTGFIEELQDTLIKTYFDYKNALESLMLERKNLVLQQENYQKAVKANDQTAIIIASALYDKSKQSELRLRQQVKLKRLQLERLAGIEPVAQLNLVIPENLMDAKYNFELSSIKKQTLKTQKAIEDETSIIKASENNDITGVMSGSFTPDAEEGTDEVE